MYNKYNKGRFRLPPSRKVRKQKAELLQKTRISIQRWIDALPELTPGMSLSPPGTATGINNSFISIQSSPKSNFSCDVTASNVLPQRLRSAAKSKNKDLEVNWPSVNKCNEVRSAPHTISRALFQNSDYNNTKDSQDVEAVNASRSGARKQSKVEFGISQVTSV